MEEVRAALSLNQLNVDRDITIDYDNVFKIRGWTEFMWMFMGERWICRILVSSRKAI